MHGDKYCVACANMDSMQVIDVMDVAGINCVCKVRYLRLAETGFATAFSRSLGRTGDDETEADPLRMAEAPFRRLADWRGINGNGS